HFLPLKVIKGRLAGGTVPGDDTPAAEPSEPSVPPPAVDGLDHPAPPPAVARSAAAAARLTEGPDPLTAGHTGASLTLTELAAATGLEPDEVRDLERFGLLDGHTAGGTTYYDEDSLVVANLAAGFMKFGVEARHLRMYRTAAGREAAFFEQVVM